MQARQLQAQPVGRGLAYARAAQDQHLKVLCEGRCQLISTLTNSGDAPRARQIEITQALRYAEPHPPMSPEHGTIDGHISSAWKVIDAVASHAPGARQVELALARQACL